MKTLYLRNVPDEVEAKLARLVARAGMSVSSFAVRELREAALRADNAAVLDGLHHHDVSADDVVAGLEGDRRAP